MQLTLSINSRLKVCTILCVVAVNRGYAKPFHGLRFTVSNRETKPQKKMCMRKNHDFRFTAQYAMEAQIGLKS